MAMVQGLTWIEGELKRCKSVLVNAPGWLWLSFMSETASSGLFTTSNNEMADAQVRPCVSALQESAGQAACEVCCESILTSLTGKR